LDRAGLVPRAAVPVHGCRREETLFTLTHSPTSGGVRVGEAVVAHHPKPVAALPTAALSTAALCAAAERAQPRLEQRPRRRLHHATCSLREV